MLKKIAAGITTVGIVTGIAAGAGVGLATPASAQGTGTTATLPGLASLVDATVTEQLRRDRIPGASVVVVAGGRQVLARGYGVANVASKRPVDADRTGFFSGSVAKVFTATAAAQLIASGKLDPKVDVNTYLRAYRAPFEVTDTYPGRPVTLENLLTHTAGFDDDPVGVAVTDPADVPRLGRYLADHQPPRVRPPGTLTAYDNYGVALAGYLVELASGTPFAQYVQQHVLAPLGMTGTTFAQPHPAAVQDRLAKGYRPEGASGQVAENGQYGAWSPTGAGTVVTATDMGRFMLAQLDHDPRLGSGVAALVQQQHFQQDPRLPGMAYLLEERPRNGRTLLFKDGDVPGFHSDMALLPDDGPGATGGSGVTGGPGATGGSGVTGGPGATGGSGVTGGPGVTGGLGVFVVYNGDGEDGVASWDGKALIHRIVDRYLPDTRPPSQTQPQAVAGTQASGVTGTYRSDRTSRTAVTKAAALVSPVTVDAASDGTLTTTGLSADPNAADQHWIPVGPGVYQERGGQERISFDGAGHLFSTQDPTVAYEKNGWSQSPTLHLVLLGFGVVTLMTALVAFPVTALVRRLRGRVPAPHAAKAARLAAVLTGALATVFTVGFVSMTSDGNAFNETVILGSTSLTALLALNTAVTVTTAGMVVATAAAWSRGWWGRTGRVLYTVTTLGAIGFLTVAFDYNMVWTPRG